LFPRAPASPSPLDPSPTPTPQIDAEEVAKRVNWKVMDLGRRGIRSLAVAKTNSDGKWQMLGILTFLDPPRPDTKETIENAMALGVDVKMITGE
jgi:H+-transporting ATPase